MKTNLTQFKKSRRPVRKGDVFIFEIKPVGTMCGWVIADDANVGLFADGPADMYLVYIYNYVLCDRIIPSVLRKTDLLIPPLICGRDPWAAGCFVYNESRVIHDTSCLRQHCFQVYPFLRQNEFRDEYGGILARRTEPCGIYTMYLVAGIDKLISDALGIPHAQE